MTAASSKDWVPSQTLEAVPEQEVRIDGLLEIIEGHLAASRAGVCKQAAEAVEGRLEKALQVLAGTDTLGGQFGTLARAVDRVARRCSGEDVLEESCRYELGCLRREHAHPYAGAISSDPQAFALFVEAARLRFNGAPQGYRSDAHQLRGDYWLEPIHRALCMVSERKRSFQTAARDYGPFKQRVPESLDRDRVVYMVLKS